MDYVWNITGRCNLKCPGCWDPFKSAGNASVDELEAAFAKIDLAQCKVITITGGEPLVHRSVFDIIRRARDGGVAEVKVCTNGTLLKRNSVALIEAGVTEVHVSLDSIDGDSHASLENSEERASASVIIEQMREFQADISRMGADIKLVLVSVVDPRNLERFEKVLEFARVSGYEVSFQMLTPFSIWKTAAVETYGSVDNFFLRLNKLLARYPRTSSFFNRLYLHAARGYAKDGSHAPCGAGELFNVIDPNGSAHACFRPGSDPVGMKCYDERCLIWSRSQKRGHRIAEMFAGQGGSA